MGQAEAKPYKKVSEKEINTAAGHKKKLKTAKKAQDSKQKLKRPKKPKTASKS